jgi:hypothetical protein
MCGGETYCDETPTVAKQLPELMNVRPFAPLS